MNDLLAVYTLGMFIFNVAMLAALLYLRADYAEWVATRNDQRCAICKLRREDHTTLGPRLVGHRFKLDTRTDK